MVAITDDELRLRTRALLEEVDPATVDRITFRGAQFDRGLAWVHFPEGFGGLGLAPRAQAIVLEELRRGSKVYDDLAVNPIGIGMGAPVVLAHGTPEMHHRFLRPLFTGEEIWCQLFSEPGSGSDVASLSTRAVRDGDEWIVNGQKVWTTLAHRSRWGLLAARTDPDQPKHKGMSYFVLDMHAPGVDVRPLYQITGEAEFNEVFLTDVRVPHTMMLGREGEGWNVAVTTLMNERVALGGSDKGKGAGTISLLVDAWRARTPRGDATDAVLRDEVTRRWIEAEVLRLTSIRARANARAGTPGPEGSVGKLASAELNKRVTETAMDVLGADAMVFEDGYPLTRPKDAGLFGSAPKKLFLRMRAQSIEGGTSEVMRNILGERVLGLPKEPGDDRHRPWSEIPRNA
jgi:alkylation response protein AidB-like acyl-CoA dehydrogenase